MTSCGAAFKNDNKLASTAFMQEPFQPASIIIRTAMEANRLARVSVRVIPEALAAPLTKPSAWCSGCQTAGWLGYFVLGESAIVQAAAAPRHSKPSAER